MKTTSRSRTAFLAAVCSLMVAASSASALMLTAVDISNNQYNYSLSFTDLNSSTKFNTDVSSQSNVAVTQQGTGSAQRNFVAAVGGQTSASFVYTFDFSASGYRPQSLALTDALNVFYVAADTATATTAYSLDGTNYITIRTNTTVGKTADQGSSGTTNISLSSLPSDVYYRVTYTANTGTFVANDNQFARSGPGVTSFNALFTVTAVPEPSGFAIIGVAAVGMAMVGKYRRVRV